MNDRKGLIEIKREMINLDITTITLLGLYQNKISLSNANLTNLTHYPVYRSSAPMLAI